MTHPHTLIGPGEEMTFSAEEVEMLNEVLCYWVSEGWKIPPYKPVLYDLFDKLLTEEDRDRLAVNYDTKRPTSGEGG